MDKEVFSDDNEDFNRVTTTVIKEEVILIPWRSFEEISEFIKIEKK